MSRGHTSIWNNTDKEAILQACPKKGELTYEKATRLVIPAGGRRHFDEDMFLKVAVREGKPLDVYLIVDGKLCGEGIPNHRFNSKEHITLNSVNGGPVKLEFHPVEDKKGGLFKWLRGIYAMLACSFAGSSAAAAADGVNFCGV